MSVSIDECRRKCEVGFTDKYKKTFEGVGRDPKSRNKARRKFRENFDKIDWNKE